MKRKYTNMVAHTMIRKEPKMKVHLSLSTQYGIIEDLSTNYSKEYRISQPVAKEVAEKENNFDPIIAKNLNQNISKACKQ